MPKRAYDCAYCGELFPNMTAHMSHVVTAHVGEKSRRPWSCWRCASDVPATRSTCECGFTHPKLAGESS